MKKFCSIEATNLKSTSEKWNTMVLYFDDRELADITRKELIQKGFKCSRIYGHVVEHDVKRAVASVVRLIGK